MQHMPDKEFDNLFRDKFTDAEIIPSGNLWANIEKALEPKKKRNLPIYWIAAASIAILITTMLVFQEKKVIQLHGTAEIVNLMPKTSISPVVVASVSDQPHQTVQVAAKTSIPSLEQNKLANDPTDDKVESFSEENPLALQPSSNNSRLPIKQQDPKPIDVLPVKEAQIESQMVSAQLLLSDKVEPNNEINESGNEERKGIRNVGDIVNYVVEKVDKRDKKLLRFKTDDDDNSSIIGINIGFLRLNKKTNKE